MRRLLTFVSLCMIALSSHAELVQGKDYRLLNPARPSSVPGKIEVIEFFSFGCPHCAEFYPTLTQWQRSLPSDVTLVKVPVSFGRSQWGQLVRAYYTFEADGQLERVEPAIYLAIHGQRQPLYSEERLASWVASQGLNAAKFRETFNSFDVSRKSQRAEQMSREYQVDSVPLLIVNGKYAITGESHEDNIRIASELIEKERQAMKK